MRIDFKFIKIDACEFMADAYLCVCFPAFSVVFSFSHSLNAPRTEDRMARQMGGIRRNRRAQDPGTGPSPQADFGFMERMPCFNGKNHIAPLSGESPGRIYPLRSSVRSGPILSASVVGPVSIWSG